MRDPKRIPNCLEIIQKIWEEQPDTRFNQLLYNLQYEYIKDTKSFNSLKHSYEIDPVGVIQHVGSSPDLFYLEDDAFFDWLNEKYKTSNN